MRRAILSVRVFLRRTNRCTCAVTAIQRYMSRLSGPLLDRIDLHINVPAVPYKELAGKANGETSEQVRVRVNEARARQSARFRERRNIHANAQMTSRDIRTYCRVDEKSHDLLRMAIQKMGLSARAYDRILKVSRTLRTSKARSVGRRTSPSGAVSQPRPAVVAEGVRRTQRSRAEFV